MEKRIVGTPLYLGRVKAFSGFLLSLALLSLTVPIVSNAAVLSWFGSGSTGNWSDSGNWGFVGTPASGDTLIFAGGQPKPTNTNDIPGLELTQLRFVGASGGYAIYGQAITLTNSIEATNTSGINFISNNITMNSPGDFPVNVGSGAALTIAGRLSGNVGLIKNSQGSLTLSGSLSNNFTGLTTVNGGLVTLSKAGSPPAAGVPGSLIVGNGLSAATVTASFSNEIGDNGNITVNNNATYNFGGGDIIGSNLTLNGNASLNVGSATVALNGTSTFTAAPTFANISGNGTLILGAGPCTFNISPGFLYVGPSLQGSSSSITKTGQGDLYFLSANTYTGLTTVASGLLWASNNLSLGTSAAGTVVSNGATLGMFGNVAITNESLTLNGVGYPTFGALDSETSTTNIWAGPIILNSNSTIGVVTPGATLRVIGSISGPGGLTHFYDGGGTLRFEGTTPNTYAGLTVVTGGTLELGKSAPSDYAIPAGGLIIGDGVGGVNSDVVRLLFHNQINNNCTVTISSSGVLQENGFVEGIGGLNGSGNVQSTGAFDQYGTNSYQFDGVISGTAGVFIANQGAHAWNGANTFLGVVNVADGHLRVNGSQPQSVVSVGVNSSLGGSGTVGNVSISGRVSPGNSLGTLSTSNVTFSAGSSFLVEIAALGSDQINMRGTGALANATLLLSQAGPVALGQQLTILNNDGAEVIGGTFAGLANGSATNLGGISYRINYAAGTGNDVVLTVTNIPGAFVNAAAVPGNGGPSLDPNSCNTLNVVFTNLTGATLTNVVGTLSSTTPGVVVTQPLSPYPNVPPLGKATNAISFQIAILPSFVCGSDINLFLGVSSGTFGAFGLPFTLPSGSLALIPGRYDVSVTTNIPDVGAIESTNVVAGLAGLLAKVSVSMWLTHPITSDLDVSLISPSGITVPLSLANGGGANFGSACAPDASRTTFDDAAATSITAGSPPFVGTFRPQGSLASLKGSLANGNWRLRVVDNFAGTVGALRCWSLFLSPTVCNEGGGACALCAGGVTINNTLTTNSAIQIGRIVRDGIINTCATNKVCPGPIDSTLRHYDAIPFYNGSSNACITVTLIQTNFICDLFSAAYLGKFNPSNLCENYLGDAGNSTFSVGGTTSFSTMVTSNSLFWVTVAEVDSGVCATPYIVSVTGGDCTPLLSAAPAGLQQVRIGWPVVAGGYKLEATPSLTTTNWTTLTNVPIATSNRFNVLDSSITPSNKFYRLHKP